eukprot:m.190980 g.190980  ORF g.190980 m.190980 type:complete len:339 (+) comp18580_c0_seq1:82-1098(+)
MYSTLVLATAVAAASAGSVFDDIVAKVNQANTTWKAADPSHRFGSLEDVAVTCGTFLKGTPNYVDMKLPLAAEEFLDSYNVPDTFDSRTQWPDCKVIAKIRDQSACGSCWAFGSTEAFEDRRCVATKEDVEFSTEDTAGCCSGFECGMSQGCNGGQPSAALEWMSKVGVVTGGDFYDNTTETAGCSKYALQPCAHHVPPSSKYPACPEKEYSIRCERSCSTVGYPKSYADDKTKGSGAVSFRSVEAMQTAIMNDGPLAVAFSVYSDFPTYKSGVYTHKTGSLLGGHAVEMIGWGTEDGTPYWLIKNSWNEQWGDGGTFKIARGTNECGIEDDVTGIKF